MNKTLALGFAFACIALPASAQVTLKLADSFPTSHYISVHAAKKFMDEATRNANGALKFEYYPTEQLGKAKDFLQLTTAGVMDIAYIVPSYVSEKMPLSAVGELPGMFATACQGSAAYWALSRDGILYDREFRPNGVKPLMAFAISPYQVSTRGAPLAKFDDLKGLKIRAAGGAFDLTLRTLGAVPIRLAAPDVRESLLRGTIDGTVGPAGSMKPYDLLTVVKNTTVGASFGGLVATYSISLKKWQGLSPEIQKALADAGEATIKSFCKVSDDQEEEAVKEFEAAGGKAWRLNDGERADLARRLEPVTGDWAKRLDDRKLPGTDVLKAFQAAAKQG